LTKKPSFVFLSLVPTAVVSAQTASAPKRGIAETDLTKFIWSTDPASAR